MGRRRKYFIVLQATCSKQIYNTLLSLAYKNKLPPDAARALHHLDKVKLLVLKALARWGGMEGGRRDENCDASASVDVANVACLPITFPFSHSHSQHRQHTDPLHLHLAHTDNMDQSVSLGGSAPVRSFREQICHSLLFLAPPFYSVPSASPKDKCLCSPRPQALLILPSAGPHVPCLLIFFARFPSGPSIFASILIEPPLPFPPSLPRPPLLSSQGTKA